MDSESSEDRRMIPVLIAISSSSLVFLTTLGIVFGSLNFLFFFAFFLCFFKFFFAFLQSPKYELFTRTEETPVDFKTTFPFGLVRLLGRMWVVKIIRTYLMAKKKKCNCKTHGNILIMKQSNTEKKFRPVALEDGVALFSSSSI